MEDEEWEAILAQAEEADGGRKRPRREPPKTTPAEKVEKSVGAHLLRKMGFEGTVGSTFARSQPVLQPVARPKNAGLGVVEEEEKRAREQVAQLARAAETLQRDWKRRLLTQAQLNHLRQTFRSALAVAVQLDEQMDTASHWSTLYTTATSLPGGIGRYRAASERRELSDEQRSAVEAYFQLPAAKSYA